MCLLLVIFKIMLLLLLIKYEGVCGAVLSILKINIVGALHITGIGVLIFKIMFIIIIIRLLLLLN